MDQKAVVRVCKQLGCCDSCCLRFLGHKNPSAFEDTAKYILKYQNEDPPPPNDATNSVQILSVSDSGNTVASKDLDNTTTCTENGRTETNISSQMSNEDCTVEGNETGPPPAKKKKLHQCVCCLGILQPSSWPQCFEKVKEVLDKKGYESREFACALSAPMSTLLREKAIGLRLRAHCNDYDPGVLTPLKEAWKWSFGMALSAAVERSLCSGAVCPLLVTVTLSYSAEEQELEMLKSFSPALFTVRSRGRRDRGRDRDRDLDPAIMVTRRAVETALHGATLETIAALPGWRTIPVPGGVVQCARVECLHSPIYIAGRYIKLSRSLPQTPWVLNGERMMESSVQEIICAPIAQLYKIPLSDMSTRLKFISAGREDVDVRCLGDGRPFAIEVHDPFGELSSAQLSDACALLSDSDQLRVHSMRHVSREQLGQLKSGEETKAKTYHALCVKLGPLYSSSEAHGDAPMEVTEEDISRINAYRNTNEPTLRVQLTQRTPLRVLHRRPLLARKRNILELSASLVPGHPRLFAIRVVTEAGTYVKEWVHGECGRTTPSLSDAIGSRVDIAALDVVKVHLQWPPL